MEDNLLDIHGMKSLHCGNQPFGFFRCIQLSPVVPGKRSYSSRLLASAISITINSDEITRPDKSTQATEITFHLGMNFGKMVGVTYFVTCASVPPVLLESTHLGILGHDPCEGHRTPGICMLTCMRW